MKDLSIYFREVNFMSKFDVGSIGVSVLSNNVSGFPELKRHSVAVLSVPEYRNSPVSFESVSDTFRGELYALHLGDNWTRTFFDLGTIVPGEKIEDTYFALAQVVAELVKDDIIPIVIGGGQDLTLACYKGFEALEQMINVCSNDNRLDVGDPNEAA